MVGTLPAAIAGSTAAAGVATVGFGLHIKGNIDLALSVSNLVTSPHEMLQSNDSIQLAIDSLTKNRPAGTRATGRDAGRLINASLRLFRGVGPFPTLSNFLTGAKSARDTIYGISRVREAISQ